MYQSGGIEQVLSNAVVAQAIERPKVPMVSSPDVMYEA